MNFLLLIAANLKIFFKYGCVSMLSMMAAILLSFLHYQPVFSLEMQLQSVLTKFDYYF